ncbi:hypothetical protein STEG23_023456, partial [Scotinomys teguina]
FNQVFHFSVKEGLMKLASEDDLANEIVMLKTVALRTESRKCRLSWFLDPRGWNKTAAVRLYFIFPGICTLFLPYFPFAFQY